MIITLWIIYIKINNINNNNNDKKKANEEG